MNPSKNHLSHKLIEVISNPVFPELDTQLRAGRHICAEDLEKHAFVHEYFEELDKFYRRYSVELIRAPEDFYYLRTKSTSILPSSQLSELEMLCGKILCLLYLSPERLAQQGIFTVQEVYDELISLIEVERLVKLINPRSTGSDLDKAKLQEKLRAALNRLARMGVISFLVKDKDSNNKFLIRSSCFRFGAEVRSGEDMTEAQEKLIRMGEIVTPESLAERERALKALAKDQTTADQASTSLANAQVGAVAEESSEPTSGDASETSTSTLAPNSANETETSKAEANDAEATEPHVTGIAELFSEAEEQAEQEAASPATQAEASSYQWAEDGDWEEDDDWDEFDDEDDDSDYDEDEEEADQEDEPSACRPHRSTSSSPADFATTHEATEVEDAELDVAELEDVEEESVEEAENVADDEDDFIIDISELADLDELDQADYSDYSDEDDYFDEEEYEEYYDEDEEDDDEDDEDDTK